MFGLQQAIISTRVKARIHFYLLFIFIGFCHQNYLFENLYVSKNLLIFIFYLFYYSFTIKIICWKLVCFKIRIHFYLYIGFCDQNYLIENKNVFKIIYFLSIYETKTEKISQCWNSVKIVVYDFEVIIKYQIVL